MRRRLVVLAYRAGWAVVRFLPEHAAYALFAVVADVLWWRRGRGVERLEGNLARVRPGLDRDGLRKLSRAGMRSYLRYWCDAFRMPGWSRRRMLTTFRLDDADDLRAEVAAGRGVVMALAHQGNWDHAGAWSALELATVTTVAERLEPEEVFEAFLAFRERLGIEIVPLRGGPPVYPTLLEGLRRGAFVPLLADRDLSSTGVEVELLGEPARMAAGPARLALDADVALYPVSVWYERLPPGAAARWGQVAHVHPRVRVPGEGSRTEKVTAMTQACADALGSGIRAHPEDWHMLQRVFTADLDPSRRAASTRQRQV